MSFFRMYFQQVAPIKGLLASWEVADVGPIRIVPTPVVISITAGGKSHFAALKTTLKWLDSLMNSSVLFQVSLVSESLTTSLVCLLIYMVTNKL